MPGDAEGPRRDAVPPGAHLDAVGRFLHGRSRPAGGAHAPLIEGGGGGGIFGPTFWYGRRGWGRASRWLGGVSGAWAAWARAVIPSACRRRIRPASVSETGFGPPGRSSRRSPTILSRV